MYGWGTEPYYFLFCFPLDQKAQDYWKELQILEGSTGRSKENSLYRPPPPPLNQELAETGPG